MSSSSFPIISSQQYPIRMLLTHITLSLGNRILYNMFYRQVLNSNTTSIKLAFICNNHIHRLLFICPNNILILLDRFYIPHDHNLSHTPHIHLLLRHHITHKCMSLLICKTNHMHHSLVKCLLSFLQNSTPFSQPLRTLQRSKRRLVPVLTM